MLHDAARFSPVRTLQSASLSTAVNGNDGAAFNFTDSRASPQTWSAMAHWLFMTERVRMNERAERVSDGRQERTVNLLKLDGGKKWNNGSPLT